MALSLETARTRRVEAWEKGSVGRTSLRRICSA